METASISFIDDIELGLWIWRADPDVTAEVLDEHRWVSADEAVGVKTKVAVPTCHNAPQPTRLGVAQGEEGLKAGDRQPVLCDNLKSAGRIRCPDADVAAAPASVYYIDRMMFIFINIIIREPGHVEYAGRLGLGEHRLSRIRVKEIAV